MLRKVWISAVVILLMPALPRVGLSWGGDGHKIVGAIADALLQKHPVTRDKVNQLSGGRSLSELAVFADCAKGFEYCQRKPTAEERAYEADDHAHGATARRVAGNRLTDRADNRRH